MCEYQGHDFGATYLDSVCIDGYLWDADSGEAAAEGWMYDSGGDIPCPECNHIEWLERFKEEVAQNGYEAAESGLDRIPLDFDKLRYPEDKPTLITWWLEGYDERKKEDGN
jgi:hypothetical protein